MLASPFTPNGQTRLYGVLGHPVQTSLSPAMQNAGFRALELNALYVAFPVLPERLVEAVTGLAAAGVAGFNLTVPHKLSILPLLDTITPEAEAIGAVNTVRCESAPGGMRLIGTNTDGAGFLRSLDMDLRFDPRGKDVLLLGAGGAARGIAHALLGAGAATLWVANRTRARARELAEALKARFPQAEIEGIGLKETGGLGPHLLVNATTVGMGDGRSPVHLVTLGVREAVVDIVYHPAETPLLREAESLGVACTNGIGMLLYQGCAAFEFWTFQRAPEGPMRQALLAALRARR